VNVPRKVSVVIPTRNGMPRFAEVLEAVTNQDCPWPYDVRCVDTASTDGTWEEIERRGIPARRIARHEFDHGRTRNATIEETDGDIIVLTVQDATPRDAHWLRELVEAVTSADDVAGAYSRQVPYPDVDPFLRMRLERWSAGRPESRVQRLDPGQRLDDLAPLDRLGVCAFDDVSSCMRREIWRRFPVPSRRFGEDVAWAKSVIESGRAIAFAADSVVVHSHDDGALAEFKRIYQDHANLHELFGVLTVPTFDSAWTNSRAQRRLYLDLLDDIEPPLVEGELTRRRAYATRLAFAETFGQWLGARSVRKAPPMGIFRWVESFVTG